MSNTCKEMFRYMLLVMMFFQCEQNVIGGKNFRQLRILPGDKNAQ